jgi:hypothetical protein
MQQSASCPLLSPKSSLRTSALQRNPTAVSTRYLAGQQTGVLLLPGISHRSDLSLLGHFQSIIHLNTKVAHSALQLGMAKKQLHCPKIFCPSVNQGCLGSPH